MKYFVVLDNSNGSPTVVAASGKPREEVICMATKDLHAHPDCMKLVDDESANPRYPMKAMLDGDLLTAKLNRLESQGVRLKDDWNEATILQRIKSRLFSSG